MCNNFRLANREMFPCHIREPGYLDKGRYKLIIFNTHEKVFEMTIKSVLNIFKAR